MTQSRLGLPSLGLGVGLRSAHFDYVLHHRSRVDWFEIVSENFLRSSGWPRYVLDSVAEQYPVVMHGVSLSIASTDPVDFEYLAELKQLASSTRAIWVSDHVCWTGVAGTNTHELVPFPLTEASLAHVVERIRIVQDYLERPLVLENPSTYFSYIESTLTEWDFLARMAEEADCGLLLDVNNVFVSSVNHGFDPETYLRALPPSRVVQMHVAGHALNSTHAVDTHDGPVADSVWNLFRLAVSLTNGVSTLLEWDEHLPAFPVLEGELDKARAYGAAGREPTNICRERASNQQAAAPTRGDRRGVATCVSTAPSHLRSVQLWTQLVLGHPHSVAAGARSRRARAALPAAQGRLDRVIAASRGLSAEQRVGLTRLSSRRRRLEAMRSLHPALLHALGQGLFDQFALAYLDQHPSTSYTLANLDDNFVDYLVATRPKRRGAGHAPAWPDFIIELAAFEHTFTAVYNGSDCERVAKPTCGRCAANEGGLLDCELRVSPGVHVQRSRYPVHEYFEAVKHGRPTPIPAPQDTIVALNRTDYTVRVARLEPLESEVLELVLNDASLKTATLASGASPRAVSTWLQTWIARGYIGCVAPREIPRQELC